MARPPQWSVELHQFPLWEKSLSHVFINIVQVRGITVRRYPYLSVD